MRTDDPYHPRISAAAQKIGGANLSGNLEELQRSPVGHGSDTCPARFTKMFDTPDTFLFPSTWHKDTHVNGRVMSIMVGSGTRKGGGYVRRLSDPDSMRGASEDEVAELAQSSSLKSARMKPTSATGGGGTRYFDLEDETVQVMFEAGDPAKSDPVHPGCVTTWRTRWRSPAARSHRHHPDGDRHVNDLLTQSPGAALYVHCPEEFAFDLSDVD